jgi:chromate reductase, NAD(P)H dehydrogenase (quinone)
MNILSLCGSLRSQSLSAALLRATGALAPQGVEFHHFQGHGQLPLFNPDLVPYAPQTVRMLWNAVDCADAIIIASPEYAHGVTSTIKNTLDWLVGHPPFAGKPVAVFNPAPRSYHADEALKEILRTMSADLIQDACVCIPVIGSGMTPLHVEASAELAGTIRPALAAIVAHVERAKSLPAQTSPSVQADMVNGAVLLGH